MTSPAEDDEVGVLSDAVPAYLKAPPAFELLGEELVRLGTLWRGAYGIAEAAEKRCELLEQQFQAAEDAAYKLLDRVDRALYWHGAELVAHYVGAMEGEDTEEQATARAALLQFLRDQDQGRAA